jgi:hypothetical protein
VTEIGEDVDDPGQQVSTQGGNTITVNFTISWNFAHSTGHNPGPDTMGKQVARSKDLAEKALANKDCADLFLKPVWDNKQGKLTAKDMNPKGYLSGADVIFRPQDREMLQRDPRTSWTAHAVSSIDDAFNKADGGKYRVGQTILLSEVAFANPVYSHLPFGSDEAKRKAATLNDDQARALAILHELRHLILDYGHERGGDANSDPAWNDELVIKCF